MKSRDKLIYNLIFGDKEEYVVHISEYIKKVYKYEKFITDIKEILEQSKVELKSEEIDVYKKSDVDIVWIIHIKR